MSIKNNLFLYKLELKAFWREYSLTEKINLFTYILFGLSVYFSLYASSIFNVNTNIILNIYLILLVFNFAGRKFEQKIKSLTSKKTKNLYTTPIDGKEIVKLKSLKFKVAFSLDTIIIISPLVISMLLIGISLLEVLNYTIIGSSLGFSIAFFKESKVNISKKNNILTFLKRGIWGAIVAFVLLQIEFVLKNRDSKLLNVYLEILSFNLSNYIWWFLIIVIPLLLLKDRIYINNFNTDIVTKNKQKQINSNFIKGEILKQFIISNREGKFINKYLNSICFYIGFLLSFHFVSQQLMSTFIQNIDIFFILTVLIASRNSKLFFDTRPFYYESSFIYTYVFARYKISHILLIRSLINICSSFSLNLIILIPIFFMTGLSIKYLFLSILVSSLFSITISLIQEYYQINKVLYFVSIGNENKMSIAKRIIWEFILTMITIYGFVISRLIFPDSIKYFTVIISISLSLLACIYLLKIIKGNKKFYGELKEYI